MTPSSTDVSVSPLSKITTLARFGSGGCATILITVASAPASPRTAIALARKVIGTVITYSPGLTSTVSPSAAASIASWISV